jgi:hypothetical protein
MDDLSVSWYRESPFPWCISREGQQLIELSLLYQNCALDPILLCLLVGAIYVAVLSVQRFESHAQNRHVDSSGLWSGFLKRGSFYSTLYCLQNSA